MPGSRKTPQKNAIHPEISVSRAKKNRDMGQKTPLKRPSLNKNPQNSGPLPGNPGRSPFSRGFSVSAAGVAALVKACPQPLHPAFTRGFLEYSQHRGGFIPNTARPAIPRTSPRWSGACPTPGSASSRAASSGTWPMSGNRPRWCLELAGLRIHGTTEQAAGGLPEGAPGSDSIGRRAPRDRRLAQRQGSPGPSHPVSLGPVFGTAQPVFDRPEGGSQGGQQAGAHPSPFGWLRAAK